MTGRRCRRGLCLAALTAIACGHDSSPTSPSNTPATFILSGRVTETAPTDSVVIPGATVAVAEGVNAGRSAVTDGSGNYSLAGLERGTFNVSVSAGGYGTGTFPVSLTASTSRSFSLARTGPRTTITPGQHRVNIDIAPGRYFTIPPLDCYWARKS